MVSLDRPVDVDTPVDRYPYRIPAIATLDELELAPITIFAGDNGTGTSTLIEAVAVATGFNVEGGGRNLRFETFATHSPLLTRAPGATSSSFDGDSIAHVPWDELESAALWRRFLEIPMPSLAPSSTNPDAASRNTANPDSPTVHPARRATPGSNAR
jgi:predicted ATPase